MDRNCNNITPSGDPRCVALLAECCSIAVERFHMFNDRGSQIE
ncbi:uncharacterized protein G2W53_016297 [Senna tora]|uniref:Uncharacterized protein n=1 Tax=Senna tora TaxID=362788 RepID=A0A834TMI2_9FABA|nr:uncharacterized protein G2W53_016297 [Senna tora]